jgi:hypothetical protein
MPQLLAHDSEGYRWLEMEMLVPMEDDGESRDRFEAATGIEWDDFDVSFEGMPINPSQSDVNLATKYIRENAKDKVKANAFMRSLAPLWEAGLTPWEFTVLPNWGTTESGRLKYLDAGA